MCYEHVTLEPPNHVIFDFIWKDLIRYYNKVVAVFENVKIFKRDKRYSDGLLTVSVLGVPFCAVYTGVEASCRYYIDRLSEPALAIVHWTDGLRYLQRLDHFPEPARRGDVRER